MDVSTFYTIAYSRIYNAMSKAYGHEHECQVNNCRNKAKEFAHRAAGLSEALTILRDLDKEVKLTEEKEMWINA